MNSDKNAETVSECAWVTPAHLGLLGLVSIFAWLSVFAWILVLYGLGADAKDPFWMAMQLGFMLGLTVLAVLVLSWSACAAARKRRWSELGAPCVIAGAMLIFTWGILFPSHYKAREDIAGVREIHGFGSALLLYINDNDGRFPDSLADLIGGGFIRKGADGRWIVELEEAEIRYVLRHPEWLDVAWGIHASQVDSNGMVVGADRPLVRPADSAPPKEYESICWSITAMVSNNLYDWQGASGESTKSAPTNSADLPR